MFRIILILLLAAAAVTMCQREEPPPESLEESFIGDQIEPRNKALEFQQDYIDATRARQDRIDAQVEDDTGGG